MAGQEAVVQALVNGLNSGRIHHAFLFTGTRGVGKTTLARILAKCLNCEQQVSATPCGECSACVDIDAGRFVDLIEVDAASRTKVDDTRELLDNVQYAATRGRYKVYLIDEVHMLSASSFNALLKTLEEPPGHVKFILATTDPQKIPVTILSRCVRFNLRRMPAEQINDYLAERLTAEQIEFEPAALQQIARAGDGSMRDALSLLDQALAHGSGRLQEQPVRTMLGMVESHFIEHLLTALQNNQADSLLTTAAEIYAQGQSADRTLQQLGEALHRIAVLQQVPAYVDENDQQLDKLREFAAAISSEDIQLYYQIASMGRSELAHAPDPRIGLDMTLLRMLAFRPVEPQTAESQATKPSAAATQQMPKTQATQAPSSPSSREQLAASVAASQSKSQQVPSQVANQVASQATASDQADKQQSKPESPQVGASSSDTSGPEASLSDSTANQSKHVDDKKAQAEQPPPKQTPPEPTQSEPKQTNELKSAAQDQPAGYSAAEPAPADTVALDPEQWSSLCQHLGFSGPLRVLTQHLMPAITSDQGVLLFKMEERDAHLHTQRWHQQLSQALAEHLQAPIKIKVQYTNDTLQSPARMQAAADDQAHREAHQVVESDAVINDLIETFDARIVPGSVRPDKDSQ